MWKYLNRGISTPIAITIILILVIAVGGFTWWQYGEIENFDNIPLLSFNKSTCAQDAASNYMGEGEDPCDRSCQVNDDCKLECGCDCISKDEQCKYTGVECEAPDPDYGCRCVDGTCSYDFIGEELEFDPLLSQPCPSFIKSLEKAEDFKISFYYQSTYPGYMSGPDFFDVEQSLLLLSKTKEKKGKYVYGPEYYSVFTEEGSHSYQGTPIFLLNKDSEYSVSHLGFKISDRDLISELKVEFGIDYRDSSPWPMAKYKEEKNEFSIFNFVIGAEEVYACGPGLYLRKVGESNLIFVEELDGVAWYQLEEPIDLYDLKLSYCDEDCSSKPTYCNNMADDPEECWDYSCCFYNVSIENLENGNLKMHIYYKPNDKEGFLGLQLVNLILTDSEGDYYQPAIGENFGHYYSAYLK